MKRLGWLLLVLAVPQGGCATAGTPPAAVADVHFELEYTNFAWQPSWRGVVVHADGSVVGYDLGGQPWEHAEREYVTRDQLEQKWAQRAQERPAAPADAAATMAARASAAAGGSLTEPQNRCADACTLTYTAYLFDAERGSYRRIVLRREGDVVQRNSAAAARQIADWLSSLELVYVPAGCRA